MKNPASASLPFRPVSLNDFFRYARDLSRLIEEPIQESQTLLAKGYGYDCLHDLQVIMAKPGSPGPFEDELWRYWPPIRPGYKERGAILLRLIAEKKGVENPNHLPFRYRKAADFRLFDEPSAHREARRRVFKELDLLAELHPADNSGGAGLGADAYASLEVTSERKLVLRGTQLGVAVFDALFDIFVTGGGTRPEAEYENQRQEQRQLVQRISDAHPNCPWPLAELVISHARALAQGGWHAPLFHRDDEFVYPEINEGFTKAIVANAHALLPAVTRSVSQFEQLYGNSRRPLASDPPQEHGVVYDVLTWPNLLYWGGRVALNAGKRDYATRLLRKVHRMNGFACQHWSREPLSALILGEGINAVLQCFDEEPIPDVFQEMGSAGILEWLFAWERRERSVWEWLALAASMSLTDPLTAAKFYTEALFVSGPAIDAFNENASTWSSLYSRDAKPLSVPEFMFLTEPFWRKHPEQLRFFRRFASHPDLLSKLLDWHKQAKEKSTYHPMDDPTLANLAESVRTCASKVAQECAS